MCFKDLIEKHLEVDRRAQEQRETYGLEYISQPEIVLPQEILQLLQNSTDYRSWALRFLEVYANESLENFLVLRGTRYLQINKIPQEEEFNEFIGRNDVKQELGKKGYVNMPRFFETENGSPMAYEETRICAVPTSGDTKDKVYYEAKYLN